MMEVELLNGGDGVMLKWGNALMGDTNDLTTRRYHLRYRNRLIKSIVET